MRKRAIIILGIGIFVIFTFAMLAVMRPNSTDEAVPLQSETLAPEQAYTTQASIYLENAEEYESLPPCCPYFVAVDFSELPPAAHENYTWILPPVFAEFGSFHNGLAAARKCCRFGIINKQNEIILPFIYKGFFRDGANLNVLSLERALENGIIAARYDGRWGAIDFTGQTLIPFEYDDVNINHVSGLTVARIGGVRESGRTSVLIETATGREIIPVGRYQSIWSFGFSSFGNNIAHVTVNNLFHGAVCTTTGKTIIPPRYDEIRSPFRGTGFLLARGSRNWILYNYRGARIRTFSEEEIPARPGAFHTTSDVEVRNERILFNPRERNAFILDLDGNEIIPPIYSSIMLSIWHSSEGKASENWAVVSTGTEHGIICIITGDVVLPLRPKGYAHVSLVINDENTAIIVEATGFEWRERIFTFIDIATNREIPRSEGFHSWTDPQPHEDLPYEITFREYGEYGGFLFGINDVQGNEIFPPNLSSVRQFGENLLRICDTHEGIWQSRLYDFITWEEILPRHDFIDLPGGGVNSARYGFPDEGFALINQGGVRWQTSMRGGKWGIISDTGEIIIPAKLNFERVRYESGDIFAVQKDGKWGFIQINYD